MSCFAKLSVTKFGTPLLGTLSLSTLPWAHGRLLNQESSFLTMENYWKAVQRLLKDLDEEFITTLSKRVVRLPKEQAGVLDHKAISHLVEILFRFAGFKPLDYPIALIETCEVVRTAKNSKFDSEQNVPILNSFYIQDLERAGASLFSQKGTPLDLYLSRKCKQRVLLEGDRGEAAVLEALKPEKLPKGRWPASRSHQQALMQQFAVNQTMCSLAEGGIFSVNGPPGTGKTTLLREIIAENIVARAEALAQFTRSKAAFTGTIAVGFEGGDPVYVSTLHPSLLGYEMVVVSSNNTAVQNLSHELPLRRQLDPAYAHTSYLEPVAGRLLDLEKNEAWGLISAALGNVENCRRLVNRVFISRDDKLQGKRIWDWAGEYSGPSFAEARDRFLSLQRRHEALADALDDLAYLHDEIRRAGSLHDKGLSELLELEKITDAREAGLDELRKEEEEAKMRLDLVEKQVELWNQQRPAIWKRLAKEKSWNEWSNQSRQYARKQIAAIDELHTRKEHIQKIQEELKELRKNVEAKELELLDDALWENICKNFYEKLKRAHRDARIPDGSLEDSENQKQGFYQTAALNHIRTELFIAAIALHEAWLAETLRQRGGFRGESHGYLESSPRKKSDNCKRYPSCLAERFSAYPPPFFDVCFRGPSLQIFRTSKPRLGVHRRSRTSAASGSCRRDLEGKKSSFDRRSLPD